MGFSEASSLPRFTEHSGHMKLQPLRESVQPNEVFVDWLNKATGDRARRDVRVLDLGCGRGGTVAWLVEQGWDAHGIDVDARYIEQGLEMLGDRLIAVSGGRNPHPDGAFDIVISDQVFEHLPDLSSVAAETARVTKPGGRGLHVFPAKWRWREPHMLTPLVHWFPKGPVRRLAIRAALKMGYAAPYFTDLAPAERAEVFATYSEQETYYRSVREIVGTLRSVGLDVDVRDVSRAAVEVKLGRTLPALLGPAAAWAYRTSRMMMADTSKRS